MSNIPVIDEETLMESYKKLLTPEFEKMNTNELEQFITNNDDLFKKRQPGIHRFVHELLDLHLNTHGPNIPTPQLVLYVMIIIDAFYSQEEEDDVRRLFE